MNKWKQTLDKVKTAQRLQAAHYAQALYSCSK